MGYDINIFNLYYLRKVLCGTNTGIKKENIKLTTK